MHLDAIISDIDGCLAPESDEPMPVEALARVAAHNRLAIRRGDRPVLTVCSGRPLPFVEAVCRIIANDRLPAVCENGVWLYDPRHRRFERDPRIRPDHVALVHAAMRWVEADLGPRGVVIQPGKTASMSLWHPDRAYLFSLIPALRERFAAEGWPFRVSTTIAWINCDLDFVSKATGVERLMRSAGLVRERTAFVGDAPGDLAARPLVGLFAAPANAHDDVKRQSDVVASAPEIEGVLELLDRFGSPTSPADA